MKFHIFRSYFSNKIIFLCFIFLLTCFESFSQASNKIADNFSFLLKENKGNMEEIQDSSLDEECKEILPGKSIESFIEPGQYDYYCFNKEANQEYFVSLNIYKGDSDLYGHYTQNISNQSYHKNSEKDGMLNEFFSFQSTQNGRYYIAVYGKERTSYQLSVCKSITQLIRPNGFDYEIYNDNIKFVWIPNDQADSYRVFISSDFYYLKLLDDDSYFCDSCIVKSGDRVDYNFLNKNISDFECNKKFYFRVRAGSSCSSSPLSDIFEFDTPPCPDDKPFVSNVSVSYKTDQLLQPFIIKWDVTDSQTPDNEIKIWIQFKEKGGWGLVAYEIDNTGQFVWYPEKSIDSTKVRVRAKGINEKWSDWEESNVISINLAPSESLPPEKPIIRSLNPKTYKTEVNLRWMKVNDVQNNHDADYYEIQCSTSESKLENGKPIKATPNVKDQFINETLSWTVAQCNGRSLEDDTTYYFRVVAVKNDMKSKPSDIESTTIIIQDVPIIDLKYQEPKDGEVNVSTTPIFKWKASDKDNDILEYYVRYGTSKDKLYRLKGFDENNYFNFQENNKSLCFHEKYYWQIWVREKGKNKSSYDGNEYPSSPIWNFTTTRTGPDLSITKVELASVLKPGEKAEFKVIVENKGSQAAPPQSIFMNYIKRDKNTKNKTKTIETPFYNGSYYMMDFIKPNEEKSFIVEVNFLDSIREKNGIIYDNILVCGESKIKAYFGFEACEDTNRDNNYDILTINYVDKGKPQITYFDILAYGDEPFWALKDKPIFINMSAKDDFQISEIHYEYQLQGNEEWKKITVISVDADHFSEKIEWMVPSKLQSTKEARIRVLLYDSVKHVTEKISEPFSIYSSRIDALLSPGSNSFTIGKNDLLYHYEISADNPIQHIRVKLNYGLRTIKIGDEQTLTTALKNSQTWQIPNNYYASPSCSLTIEVNDIYGAAKSITSKKFTILPNTDLPYPFKQVSLYDDVFKFPDNANFKQEFINISNVKIDEKNIIHSVVNHSYSYETDIPISTSNYYYLTHDTIKKIKSSKILICSKDYNVLDMNIINSTPYVLLKSTEGFNRLAYTFKQGNTFVKPEIILNKSVPGIKQDIRINKAPTSDLCLPAQFAFANNCLWNLDITNNYISKYPFSNGTVGNKERVKISSGPGSFHTMYVKPVVDGKWIYAIRGSRLMRLDTSTVSATMYDLPFSLSTSEYKAYRTAMVVANGKLVIVHDAKIYSLENNSIVEKTKLSYSFNNETVDYSEFWNKIEFIKLVADGNKIYFVISGVNNFAKPKWTPIDILEMNCNDFHFTKRVAEVQSRIRSDNFDANGSSDILYLGDKKLLFAFGSKNHYLLLLNLETGAVNKLGEIGQIQQAGIALYQDNGKIYSIIERDIYEITLLNLNEDQVDVREHFAKLLNCHSNSVLASWGYGVPFNGKWNEQEDKVEKYVTRKNFFKPLYPNSGKIDTFSSNYIGDILYISDNYLISLWDVIFQLNDDCTIIHPEVYKGNQKNNQELDFQSFGGQYKACIVKTKTDGSNKNEFTLFGDNIKSSFKIDLPIQTAKVTSYDNGIMIVSGRGIGYQTPYDDKWVVAKVDTNSKENTLIPLGDGYGYFQFKRSDMNSNQMVAISWKKYIAYGGLSGDFFPPQVQFTNSEKSISKGLPFILKWSGKDNNLISKYELHQSVSGTEVKLATLEGHQTEFEINTNDIQANHVSYILKAYDNSNNTEETIISFEIVEPLKIENLNVDKHEIEVGENLVFKWNVKGVSDSTSYTIFIQDNQNEQWSILSHTTNTYYALSDNILPGTYRFKIATADISKELTDSVYIKGAFNEEAFISEQENKTVKFAWDLKDNLQKKVQYELHLKYNENDIVIPKGNALSCEYEFSEIIDTYEWYVTAIYNNFEYSSNVRTIKFNEISIFEQLNTELTQEGNVIVSWLNSDDSEGMYFNLYRNGEAYTSTYSNSYTDVNALAGVEYCYSVAAAFDRNEWSLSETSCIINKSIITQVNSKITKDYDIQLNWIVPDDIDIEKFVIYRNGISYTSTQNTSFIDFQTEDNVEYCYTVVADSSESFDWNVSEKTCIIKQSNKIIIDKLEVTEMGRINLSWTTPKTEVSVNFNIFINDKNLVSTSKNEYSYNCAKAGIEHCFNVALSKNSKLEWEMSDKKCILYDPPKPELLVSSTNIDLPSSAGKVKMRISNLTSSYYMPWKATISYPDPSFKNNNWICLSKTKNNYYVSTYQDIDITFQKNWGNERNCVITIDSSDAINTPILINIKQASGLTESLEMNGPIPDTDQTQCYDDNQVINCRQAGEPYSGQDANYNINNRSFTKLDKSGNELDYDSDNFSMVKDNITGLIWEIKTDDNTIHDKNNVYAFEKADLSQGANDLNELTIHDFIEEINTNNYGGFSDWRIPTIKELYSIVYYLYYYNEPVEITYFSNLVGSYWSSNIYNSDIKNVWGISFDSKNALPKALPKSFKYNAIAVRGGENPILGRFVSSGDGTVTDINTGLMWQKAQNEDNLSWKNALKYCEELSTNGFSDWRLPNIKELMSIIDYYDYNSSYPPINKNYFNVIRGRIHISSTTSKEDFSRAMGINYSMPFLKTYNKTSKYCSLRAVRGGQNQIQNNLFINYPRQGSKWTETNVMPIKWETQGLHGYVKIQLSRKGGKPGTYEVITEKTENDGSFEWIVNGDSSFNCILKIEHLDDTTKSTAIGLFTIYKKSKLMVTPNPIIFTAFGGKKSFTIVTSKNSSFCWALFPSDNSWIKIDDNDYSGTNERVIEIDCDINLGEERSMYIRVIAEGVEISEKTIEIIQKGPEFENSYVDNTLVPDTVQNKCYDNEKEIECPKKGEPFYGPDAQYNINTPIISKYDDQANQLPDNANIVSIVRDDTTGVYWELKTNNNVSDNITQLKTWDEAHNINNLYKWNSEDFDINRNELTTKSLIDFLNITKFGNFNDWRLPTIKELFYICDLNDILIFYRNPSNSYDSTYCSSTYHNNQHIVFKKYGFTTHSFYKNSYYNKKELAGIAVRSIQEIKPPLFRCNHNIIIDPNTGLMWQRLPETQKNWQNALKYCENLNIEGYNDWRLPNVKELVTIAEFLVDYHWSSTTHLEPSSYSSYEKYAHVIKSFIIRSRDKTNLYHIRAVRGGQNQIKENLFITSPKQASFWKIGEVMPIKWETKDIQGNVKISISKEGGKEDSFETIAEETDNNGSFHWIVSADPSYNCMLRIEPLSDPSKGTIQGLFSILKSNDECISLSTNSVMFDKNGGISSVDISTKTDWSINKKDADWIDISSLTGSNNKTLTINCKENLSPEARKTVISITPKFCFPKTIEIIQPGTDPFIKISKKIINRSYLSGDESISIISNISWDINSDSDWISISQTFNSNTQYLTISCLTNNSSSPRIAYITIMSDSYNISKTIQVIQTEMNHQPYIELSDYQISNNHEININKIDIFSNIAWEVKNEASWISIRPLSGHNSQQITITSMSNADSISRTASIKIQSRENESIYQTIYVNQLGSSQQHETHFQTSWQGNPIDSMKIWIITQSFQTLDLEPGDEIAVFDGDICVGFKTIVSTSDDSFNIVTSSRDDIDPGFTEGHLITFRVWDDSEQIEIIDIAGSFFKLSGEPTDNNRFKPNADIAVNLSFSTVTQNFNLVNGWNIISFYVMPKKESMLEVFKDLIDDKALFKIIDEQGERLIYNAFSKKWVNEIGSMCNEEGYQVKVNKNVVLTTKGLKVPLPYEIALSEGWNIFGWPIEMSQNPMNVIQPLIDNKVLIKVIDEQGRRIIYNAFSKKWINEVGEFNPGKGFLIKVKNDSSLIVNKVEQRKKKRKRNIINKTQKDYNGKHCSPIWSGYPYNSLKFWIVEVNNFDIELNDEICIFDCNKCVGMGVVNNGISYENILTIISSQDDGSGNGFKPGNEIIFKIWDASEAKEITAIVPEFMELSTGDSIDPAPTFSGNTDLGVKLTVISKNNAPVITDINDQTIYQNTKLTIPISTHDPDGDDITLTAQSNNENVEVSITNSELVIQPKIDWYGEGTIITVHSADARGLSDTTNFHLTVNENLLKIIIPTDNYGFNGTRVSLPIIVDNPKRVDIEGIDLAIDKNEAVLKKVGATATLDGSILEDKSYKLTFNPENGKLKIWAINAYRFSEITGTIAFIEFDVIGSVGSSSSITLTQSLVNRVPVKSYDGLFFVANSCPVFTKGSDIVENEDSSVIIPNWATNINSGNPNENQQQLEFTITTGQSDLFEEGPTISTDNGTLSYVPKKDAFGTANITVTLSDDGGIQNGGCNTSEPQTFKITINPNNDCPYFTKGEDQIISANQTVIIPNWATNISSGPENESDQNIAFYIETNNDDIFKDSPKISDDGTLIFTPKADQKGQAIVKVYLQDDGTVDGCNTSNTDEFTISINKYELSGNVFYYYEDKPVPNVSITLDGSYSTTIKSDKNGHFSFPALPPGKYTLILSKSDDLKGISGNDATNIAGYSVGLEEYRFNCHQLIAADIFYDNEILSTNPSRVAQYAAGVINCFTDNAGCKHWHFIADDTCTWPQYNSDSKVEIDLNSDITDITLKAIRMGDVTGNWSSDTTTKTKSNKHADNYIEYSLVQGSKYSFPVVINEKGQIKGIDIVVAFDNNVVTVDRLSLSGVFTQGFEETSYSVVTNKSTDGINSFVVYTTPPNIYTSEEAEVLLNLDIQVIGQVGDEANLSIIKLQANENEMTKGGFFINGDIYSSLKIKIKDNDSKIDGKLGLEETIQVLNCMSGETHCYKKHSLKDIVDLLQLLCEIQ